MIAGIEKSGIGMELEEEIKAYIDQKIGKLDRFIPRQARKSVHAEVKMREANGQRAGRYTCEVILHLPGEQVTVRESTLNLPAAVDIVEAKLKNCLKKYKEAYMHERRTRRRSWLRNINFLMRNKTVTQ